MSIGAELPDKLFFKIGEVKDLVGVKPHVLRYWESEFPSAIRPQKSKTNQRLYRRKDIEAILAIKHLLYDRKFTIEGARKHLREEGVQNTLPPPPPEAIAEAIRREMDLQSRERIAVARKKVIDHYEKHLLELKRDVLAFVNRIQTK